MNTNISSDSINELGEPTIVKKRVRKTKKQIEKELLNEYYEEVAVDLELELSNKKKGRKNKEKDKEKEKDDTDIVNMKKTYENMQYLSAKEKAHFEEKFTKPININQEEYVKALKNKSKKIIIASGPAGTGKTLFATEYGIKHFLLGNYEKLIFTRPNVSVDEELGFLPGTMEEKMAPWIRPIYDVLYNFISPKEVQQMMEDKVIEIAPLGYMRGRTFKNCWIVADEMQNSTVSQMKMLLTRLGQNSRLVITGDLEQFDRVNELNGLADFLHKMKGRESESIHCFMFHKGDIQREQVVREILDIYDSV
jgi:phosphate starvation-inducible PhoH-like protein